MTGASARRCRGPGGSGAGPASPGAWQWELSLSHPRRDAGARTCGRERASRRRLGRVRQRSHDYVPSRPSAGVLWLLVSLGSWSDHARAGREGQPGPGGRDGLCPPWWQARALALGELEVNAVMLHRASGRDSLLPGLAQPCSSSAARGGLGGPGRSGGAGEAGHAARWPAPAQRAELGDFLSMGGFRPGPFPGPCRWGRPGVVGNGVWGLSHCAWPRGSRLSHRPGDTGQDLYGTGFLCVSGT